MKIDLIKDIKYKNLADAIKHVLLGGFFIVMFFLAIYITDSNGASFISAIIFYLFISLFILLGLFFLYKGFIFLDCFFNPLKTPIFKIYNDIPEIFKEIEQAIEYNDYKIIISKDYMVARFDNRKLFNYDDILGIYVREYRVNNMQSSLSIVVNDKYNRTGYFDYLPEEKDKVNKVMSILESKCKQAKFGYNDETLSYIRNNQIKL